MLPRILTVFGLALLALLAGLPAPSRAQLPGTTMVTGAGLVDYSRPEKLKPGSWVRYHLTDTQGQGEQKIMVTGFETVGRERCVWIETEFKVPGSVPRYSKILVALSISKLPDHDYIKAMPLYQRRLLTMTGMGHEIQKLDFPKVVQAQSSNIPDVNQNVKDRRDTLATTPVVTDAGRFLCRPVRFTRDARFLMPGKEPGSGKRYHRQQEETVDYQNERIPVTGLARRTYRGTFKDASLPPDAPPDADPPGAARVMQKDAVLVDFGTDGVSAFPRNAKAVPMRPQGRRIR